MRSAHAHAALHATLQFVRAAEIPPQHRTVLIEVLNQALHEQQTNSPVRRELPPGWEWQPHEVVLLQSSLDGKVAKSWQHADELVMLLAAQLNRDARSVRAKATELGLSAAVDYRVARALAPEADE